MRNNGKIWNDVILVSDLAHLDKLMVVSSTTFSTALFDLESKAHEKLNNVKCFDQLKKYIEDKSHVFDKYYIW